MATGLMALGRGVRVAGLGVQWIRAAGSDAFMAHGAESTKVGKAGLST